MSEWGHIRRTEQTYTIVHRDTVASVGWLQGDLPHAISNDGVRVFRHALALDETRQEFFPKLWCEPRSSADQLEGNVLATQKPSDGSRDEWVYEPPSTTDVEEVWFAGWS